MLPKRSSLHACGAKLDARLSPVPLPLTALPGGHYCLPSFSQRAEPSLPLCTAECSPVTVRWEASGILQSRTGDGIAETLGYVHFPPHQLALWHLLLNNEPLSSRNDSSPVTACWLQPKAPGNGPRTLSRQCQGDTRPPLTAARLCLRA